MDQPKDWFILAKVLPNNDGHILDREAGIPDAVGFDVQIRGDVAQAETTAWDNLNLLIKLRSADRTNEGLQHLLRSLLRAGQPSDIDVDAPHPTILLDPRRVTNRNGGLRLRASSSRRRHRDRIRTHHSGRGAVDVGDEAKPVDRTTGDRRGDRKTTRSGGPRGDTRRQRGTGHAQV